LSDEFATLERLKPLIGSWSGTGRGDYPTIDAFRYSEETVVSWNGVEALLHVQQRTWVDSDGDDHGTPLHWESGFLLPKPDGGVELSTAQNGVRVEILGGTLATLDEGWELTMDSLLLGHDDRLVRTQRTFALRGDRLDYLVKMETTRNRLLQQHLTAQLTRIDAGAVR